MKVVPFSQCNGIPRHTCGLEAKLDAFFVDPIHQFIHRCHQLAPPLKHQFSIKGRYFVTTKSNFADQKFVVEQLKTLNDEFHI